MPGKPSILPLILIALALAGCAAAPPPEVAGQSVADSLPTMTPGAVVAETTVPAAAEAATPSPAAEVGGGAAPQASGQGPWLLFLAGNAEANGPFDLWISSADGSDLRRLSTDPVAAPANLSASFAAEGRAGLSDIASPDGQRVAYITQTGEAEWRGLTLVIQSIPSGEIEAEIPLTSAETEPPPGIQIYEAPAFEALRSIIEVTSLDWSPDGTKLAFLGAQAGPSSDLFVFDTADASVTRITDGPGQGLRPSWSPDGRYILHLSITSMGTGAGIGLDRVWAATPDGVSVEVVYQPADSGNETWLAWTGEHTAIIYSWDAICGNKNLRTLNIETGQGRPLWDGYFNDAAYAPELDKLLVSVDPFGTIEGCSAEGIAPGLYLVDMGELGATPVGQAGYGAFWQPEANRWTVLWGEGSFGSVTAEGSFSPVAGPDYPSIDIAPDGAQIAWAKSAGFGSTPQVGVWVGDWATGAATQILEVPAEYALWTPDSQALMIFSEGQLWIARSPDFTREAIGEVGTLRGYQAWAWVGGS